MEVKGVKQRTTDDETGTSPSLVSLAQQVSFPNWNVMVGNLGDKFTRRVCGSNESSTNYSNGGLQDNVTNRHQNMEVSSTESSLFENTQENKPLKKETETVKVPLIGNPVTSISTRRMRCGRKLGIVTLPSLNDEEQNGIVDNYSEKGGHEALTEVLSSVNQKINNTLTGLELRQDSTSSDKDRESSDDTKSLSNSASISKPSPEFVRPPFRKRSMSYSGGSPVRVELTSSDRDTVHVLIDSPALKTHHAHFKFDGVHSEGEDSNKLMRRRGTIDIAALGRTKSPKLDRRLRKSDKKSCDPSHYLMQNGRRRGSYNPTYNQSLETLNRGKQRSLRAQSMFTTPEDSVRKALAARLMAHASPELKESLQRQEELASNESPLSTRKDHPLYSVRESSIESVGEANENEKENHDMNLAAEKLDLNSNVENGALSSEMTKRKISFSKSSSFGSRGELDAMINDDKVKSQTLQHVETRKHQRHFRSRNKRYHLNLPNNGQSKDLIRQMSMHDTDDGLSSDAGDYTDSEIISNRSSSLKQQPHVGSPGRRQVSSTRSLSPVGLRRNFIDSPKRDFRARTTRAQSSFDGVQPSFLSHLREKNAERERRDSIRTISSSSSSEDGETTKRYPLHVAAKRGDCQQIHRLLSEGHAVNAVDEQGWPAIHYALAAGHFDCVAKLMNAGANVRDYSKGRTLKYFK